MVRKPLCGGGAPLECRLCNVHVAAERVDPPAPARAVDGRSPFVRLRELLGDAPPGKPAISLAVGEPQHRGAVVRRPSAGRAYRRVRPLSHEQGHRRVLRAPPPTGSAAASRCRGRSIRRPRCWCSTARARACSSPRSRPQRWVSGRRGRPAMLMPNPFYAAYAAGALAADCEPVYLPATARPASCPISTRSPTSCWRARSRSTSPRPRTRRARSPTPPISRGWSALARRFGFLRVQRRVLFGDLHAARAAPACSKRPGPTSPTWWCSSRCRSARTCPACASASRPATGTSSRRFLELRNVAAPQVPLPAQRVAIAAYARRGARRGEPPRSTRRNSISPTRSSATATATGGRPAASSSGSTCRRRAATRRSTLRLWREAGLRVVPGRYLAREQADGSNPGDGYIRVAMVQDNATTAEALHASSRCWAEGATMSAIDRSLDSLSFLTDSRARGAAPAAARARRPRADRARRSCSRSRSPPGRCRTRRSATPPMRRCATCSASPARSSPTC